MPASSQLPTKTLQSTPQELTELVRDAVSRGAHLWIKATGTSMSPAIPSGSAIRLAPVAAKGVRRGDVVMAAFEGGRVAVHRVVSVTGDAVTLQGDARGRVDPPVPRGNVLAIVDRVVVDGRSYSAGARSVIRFVDRVQRVARRVLRNIA